MNSKAIVYWPCTAVLALAMLSGGAAQLAHQKDTLEGITHLGYPVYFVTILGFWKVLGGITLLVPGFPRLKEWAYAGAFFEMTGAAASHAAVRDTVWHVTVTLSFALLVIVSWALRPASRRLPNALPSATVSS